MTAGAVDLPVAPGDPTAVKVCCGDLWAHPAIQLLAGDAFRPGGVPMTAALVERLQLAAGSSVLDIGSGTGATLRWLGQAGHRAVGVDYSAGLASTAVEAGPVSLGDAEALPFASGCFDAVLAECVLSVVPDKPAAVAEVRRVLRQGGRAVLSDVTVAGPLPAELDSLLGWVACASGALPDEQWRAVAAEAGLRVVASDDHAVELRALVAQARRRLALLQGAVATGIAPAGLELTPLPGMTQVLPGIETLPLGDGLAFAQQVLGRVAAAVDAGDLGYVSIVAVVD